MKETISRALASYRSWSWPSSRSQTMNSEAVLLDRYFRSVLERPATDDELEHHIRRNTMKPTLVAEMLNSNEIIRRSARRLAHPEELTLIRNPLDTIHHAVSFGANCYTSAFMKRWSLKTYSGPFDWIFSTPWMVSYCIEDNFSSSLTETSTSSSKMRPGIS